MFLAGEQPLPSGVWSSWRSMGLGRSHRRPDTPGRDSPFDCGEREASWTDPPARARAARDHVDHHHDNNRFGKLNLIVAEASSTAEIVRDLLAELDVALTPEIAEALYVGLVTDTGRFQYTNTTPKALRLAASSSRRAPTCTGSSRQLREHRVPEAEAARASPRARAALRGREAGRLLHHAARLRRGRCRGAVLRGDHRLPARGRGIRDGGADPGAAADRRPDAGSASGPRAGTGRRLRDRPQGERWRAPPGGRVLERGLWSRRSRSSSTASTSPPATATRRRTMPPGAFRLRASCWSTSPPDRRRSPSWVSSGRTGARTGHAGHARSVRHGAPAPVVPVRQPLRHTSSGWTSATRPIGRPPPAHRHWRPRGRPDRRARPAERRRLEAPRACGRGRAAVPAVSAIKIDGERAYRLAPARRRSADAPLDDSPTGSPVYAPRGVALCGAPSPRRSASCVDLRRTTVGLVRRRRRGW